MYIEFGGQFIKLLYVLIRINNYGYNQKCNRSCMEHIIYFHLMIKILSIISYIEFLINTNNINIINLDKTLSLLELNVSIQSIFILCFH